MNKIGKTVCFSLLSLLICLGAGLFEVSSAQEDGKVYELRIYTATPGNLDNLQARFRDHTIRIFNNHGMKIVGFWTPTSEEEADDTLIYVLEHASQEAANASWQAFGQDPEWKSVSDASNANGPILAGVERRYMKATDYSPLQ
ncbi:NIPSNAP family protein [Gammaproteobacteria bacterium]|nr:NIPSNAP family protein [Gammaproteobacteria bacterium]MDC0413550.1 NIPSNAP family protein [Gammaproteobacteria bacterium]MDC3196907.1 NIPSNAP family protein [Gammaproteobacteria bacterium]